MKDKTVEELNRFLEGNLMAIHAYDQYIHHADDSEIKNTLQEIQRSHKEHAALVAERIQNLGGLPINDLSLRGLIAEFFANLKEPTDGTTHILRDAIAGEDRGIEVSRKLVARDLDPESLQLVERILEEDEEHISLLNKHLH